MLNTGIFLFGHTITINSITIAMIYFQKLVKGQCIKHIFVYLKSSALQGKHT